MMRELCPSMDKIALAPTMKTIPLTQAQLGIWLAQMLDPLDPCYNLSECVEIAGAVDHLNFERALRHVVGSEDALHLRFVETEDGPNAYFEYDPNWDLIHKDFSAEANPEQAANAWMRERRNEPFDLHGERLYRFALLRISSDRYFWFAIIHHIVNDAAGWRLLLQRVGEAYSALAEGNALPAQPPGSWLDVVAEDRAYRNSTHYQRDRAFWQEQLADLPARVTLSGRPPERPAGFATTTCHLPHSIDLEALARPYSASPAVITVAATAIYLHRMTGLTDLMIGMPVAARIGPKSRSAVGMSANVLPLRVSIDPSEKIGDVIARTARSMRSAFRHQRYRIEDVRSALGLKPSDPDICGTYVNFTPFDEDIAFGGQAAFSDNLVNWRVEDLQVVYFGGTHPDGQRIDVVGNPEHYTPEELSQHARRFIDVFKQIAAAEPDAPVDSIDLLTADERHKILGTWNETAVELPAQPFIRMFEDRAAERPDAPAVTFEDVTLSYGELNARANALAQKLVQSGVSRGMAVGVCVERSLSTLVALLAVQKSGGAYVPLDPGLPPQRLEYMVSDSGLGVVLVGGTAGKSISFDAGITTIDADATGDKSAAPHNPAVDVEAADPAYIIYTSGSTGQPKGVVVSHGALTNLLHAAQRKPGLTKNDVLAAVTTISFDVAGIELYGPLLVGARLVIVPTKTISNGPALAELLATSGTTVVFSTPAIWRMLIDAEWQGDRKIRACTGGEALSPELANQLLERVGELWNLYGPTETTIWSTALRVERGSSEISIGRPIDNTQVYVLNGLSPAPIGVAGEICIGGAGVAIGYHDRPELTAERFVPNPFSDLPTARIYRTGDLGKWGADGRLYHLGRIDDQVKINGIRVELPEIEAALTASDHVREAAVIPLQEGGSTRQLVAFISGAPGMAPPSENDLRAHLARFLPEPLIPSVFVALGDLPRLPNSKIDRRSLAEQANAIIAEIASSGAPLRTPTELTLGEIWRDVLKRSTLGRTDDFFALGGDSLRAIQVMTRVRRMFELDLPLSTVFEARRLEALAKRIDVAVSSGNGGARHVPAIVPASADAAAPLSFSQQRMWTIQSLDPQNTAYNMSSALLMTGPLDVDALTRALNEIYERHEILRTTYEVVDGKVVQHVQSNLGNALKHADLVTVEADPKRAALSLASAEARAPIDLANGPVFSAKLTRIGPTQHILQLTMHHIASDQWSAGVIGRELAMLYNAYREGKTPELPAPAVSYRDFSTWQRAWLDSDEIAEQVRFWRETLDGVPPLELPTDRPRPRVPSLNGSFVQADVPSSLFAQLEQLGRDEAATLFMTMFAGFAALLHRLSGQGDFSIGVPVANRTDAAVEQVVGTFVNLLAMRVDLSGDPTFSELLRRVRATALDAFARQDVPFDKLVQELVQSRDTSRAPLTQVMFNVLNAPMHGIELDDLTWELLVLDRGGAQFEISVSVDRQITETMTVEYNTDLFDKVTIERFVARYLRLLGQAAMAPDTRLSEIDILVDDERCLLQTSNATDVEMPAKPFIHMFEDRAAERPDVPAVMFEGVTLSYQELNARANALAQELAGCGVTRGVRVGVCVDRSLAMLVSLLAVQKSGGAYVPLDPGLPAQRLEYMASDSGLSVTIVGGPAGKAVELPSGVVTIDADRFSSDSAPADVVNPGVVVEHMDPAYIIYTSGSTGRPKGVAVSHGALANFLCSMQKEPGLGERDVLAAVTTISFDIAGLELYLPLLVGAQIALVPSTTASDGKALSELLVSSGATVMQATPATWRMLIDAGWQGGDKLRALCGGEALPPELADQLLERVGELWNLYGPTETTIWSTVSRVERGDTPITIGHPIDNTQVYILNGLSQAPVGTAGEICIGGEGVAIGYHGRPDLTAERFVPDPFSGSPTARIYRTGDLGKWGADGRLYHLGRMDHQVKIRGFRIETDEIEVVLKEHPAVRQAVVVAREIGPGDLRLIAYIVYGAGEELTISEVRSFLRTRLPDYMIPAMAVALDRLPLTANGKLDRNALPEPFGHATRPASAFEEPGAGVETVVADLWRQLLKVDKVGAEDNFFELGGDSLLALRFVAQIERQTATRIDPRTLFFQNLRQIAAGVSELSPHEELSPQ